MSDDAPSSAADGARDHEDRLLVYGLSDGGRTAHVLRQRDGAVEAGRLRPVESGQPLTGDLVALHRRPEFPLLFDVDVQVESPLKPRHRADHVGGPPRVASAAYRRGWDAIWGRAAAEGGDGPDHGLPH